MKWARLLVGQSVHKVLPEGLDEEVGGRELRWMPYNSGICYTKFQNLDKLLSTKKIKRKLLIWRFVSTATKRFHDSQYTASLQID
jgi:hypothetical protein